MDISAGNTREINKKNPWKFRHPPEKLTFPYFFRKSLGPFHGQGILGQPRGRQLLPAGKLSSAGEV
jgi:hypothetical protein